MHRITLISYKRYWLFVIIWAICPVWSESSLSAWRKLVSLAAHRADSEDSDQIIKSVLGFWYRSLFLDLHLSISNWFVSSKIYDKRDNFDFDIVNFPFLDGDVPRSTSYRVYISQLIRFARVSSHVADFNARNKSLTAKLLQLGYRYHKLRKTFSKFYRRHYELVSKFNVGLKTLLYQGLSEPEFYGDLVYKFKRSIGRADFSDQIRKKYHVSQTYWI